MALLCVETQLKDKMITKVVVEPQQNVVFIFASYEEVLIVKHSTYSHGSKVNAVSK